MPTSLYQKYRPQQFCDLIGQDHIRTTLLSEVNTKSFSHAYLFSGPRGIGKTTTARLLARVVNCIDPQNHEPCNECKNCVTIIEGKALDLFEIDAASHTGVDNVRENIIENARVAPSFLAWKVFIIDEVHMLSTSAFNALLKTLEEPPSHTMFILATTELHKVPATIISRCEHFTFHKAHTASIIQRLETLARNEGRVVDRPVLAAIAQRSEGALRDAESLLGQLLSLEDQHITTEVASLILPSAHTQEVVALWQELVQQQTSEAITRVNRLYDEGVSMTEFVKEMIEFLRCVLLYRIQQSLSTLETIEGNTELLKSITTTAATVTPDDIVRCIEELLRAQEQFKTTPLPQLPLELAIVHITAGDQKHAHPSANGQNASRHESIVQSQPSLRVTVEEKKIDSTTESAELHDEKNDELTSHVVPSQNPDNITLDTIRHSWNSLLSAMKQENHGLHLTFRVGKILDYDPATKTLTLGFQYKFYHDRLHDARNQPVITKVFSSIFGIPMILATDIHEDHKPAAKEDVTNITEPSDVEVENVWELAQAAFGTSSEKPQL